VLGILLIIACFAYVAGSVTSINLPDYMRVVSRVMLSLAGIGEGSTLIWLLVKRAKVPLREARPSHVS
jgi:hypothetical protein